MMRDMEDALGIKGEILVTSAYRSYEYQEKLFSKYVSDLVSGGYTAEAAIAEVMRTSARPGSSEHQSGLCVDLIEKGELSLEVTFENTGAFRWLSDNAHHYGFILRYPADKEALTGYSYEPWHYRFVGIDAATVIYEDKICLEEYLVKY
jgi:D-alanyl-D-alanine carboxypeptidase